MARRLGLIWALLPALGVVVLCGCGSGSSASEVSGKVTVDGQTPAAGSSISFIPMDGRSQTAGDVIENGQYSADVQVGNYKVEIRVPRPAKGASVPKAGPGSEGPGAGGGLIEESLPARFNDATELKIDVKPGRNPKDWELSTK